MASFDSLEEYENEFFAYLLENEAAVRRFVNKNRKKNHDGGSEDPRDCINREVTAVFRLGVSKYLRKTIWDFIDQTRKAKNLTQEQIAQMAGISQPTYSKIRHGDTNFESILMVVRALGFGLNAVPSPPVREQTAEGMLAALSFVHNQILDRGLRSPTREEIEWLLHLQACGEIWLVALNKQDEQVGDLVGECFRTSISIRLGVHINKRSFSTLEEMWKTWITTWEICLGAIWTGGLVG